MGNADDLRAEHRLRANLAGFLRLRAPWLPELARILPLASGDLQAFLFGGLLRDLVIRGPNASPRDIDIVVGEVSPERLADVLRPYIQRQTRFGGFQLKIAGVEIDLWPLQSTWAFARMGLPSPSFADLPRTTFLDIEAAAFELPLRQAESGRLYTFGFFEAFARRTVEINFEENPYPVLCLARSLDLASRFGFSIGPRLSRFALEWLDRLTEGELLAAHQAAHGIAPSPSCLFFLWHEAIKGSKSGVPVPPPFAHPVAG